MPISPLPESGRQLLTVARAFTALQDDIRALDWTPGTEAAEMFIPLVARTHELTTTTLTHLTTLTKDTGFTSAPGGSARLSTIAAAAASASSATAALTSALMELPYDGAPFPGYPAPTEEQRNTQRAAAQPVIAELLADAAHRLDVGATCLHYTAATTGRSRDTATLTTSGPWPGHATSASSAPVRGSPR
ncbi:hypothetical protein [Streptomyces jumonjinensis]|uniref:hypothetical protein n=1 Tax=Streptomyces jumonjinensis TaxID=1945 RepID=UPI0037B21171